MSTASAGFAEAYMMRKLQKEKMKKMDTCNKLKSSQDQKVDSYNHEGKSRSATASGGGCFSLLTFKKIHPTTAPPSDS